MTQLFSNLAERPADTAYPYQKTLPQELFNADDFHFLSHDHQVYLKWKADGETTPVVQPDRFYLAAQIPLAIPRNAFRVTYNPATQDFVESTVPIIIFTGPDGRPIKGESRVWGYIPDVQDKGQAKSVPTFTETELAKLRGEEHPCNSVPPGPPDIKDKGVNGKMCSRIMTAGAGTGPIMMRWDIDATYDNAEVTTTDPALARKRHHYFKNYFSNTKAVYLIGMITSLHFVVWIHMKDKDELRTKYRMIQNDPGNRVYTVDKLWPLDGPDICTGKCDFNPF